MTEIILNNKEITKLFEWMNKFGNPIHEVRIITTQNEIGKLVRAEVELSEGEGRWIDITDYNSW
jgi:hypothetical protein